MNLFFDKKDQHLTDGDGLVVFYQEDGLVGFGLGAMGIVNPLKMHGVHLKVGIGRLDGVFPYVLRAVFNVITYDRVYREEWRAHNPKLSHASP